MPILDGRPTLQGRASSFKLNLLLFSFLFSLGVFGGSLPVGNAASEGDGGQECDQRGGGEQAGCKTHPLSRGSPVLHVHEF